VAINCKVHACILHASAAKFGIKEEDSKLATKIDHHQLPNGNMTTTGEEFDDKNNAKKIQVSPTDPKKTANVSADLSDA